MTPPLWSPAITLSENISAKAHEKVRIAHKGDVRRMAVSSNDARVTTYLLAKGHSSAIEHMFGIQNSIPRSARLKVLRQKVM